MVEYNTINAKLSDSQLTKLKSAVKNKQGTTLRMSARIFNGNNLPHELLLTTRQTAKLRNAIENNMATDIKLSKVQMSKIIQSGEFLGKLLGPLLKTGLPLLKSVIKPLGLLGLTVTSSAIDVGAQKKYLVLVVFQTLLRHKNSNNLKSRNEWHNENCSSFRKPKCFIERSY